MGRAETLAEALDAVSGGGSVLFSGVAGIGKSTLLGQVVRGLGGSGVRVLQCAPAHADAQLPFVSLIDLLSPVPAEVFEALAPVPRRAVDAALLRGEIPDAAPDPLAVRLGVLQAFRALLALGALVVAIDDVQWVDPPSAQVLEFLARRLPGAGLRVVAAGRGTYEEVERFVPMLPEGARRIEIGPMPDEALVPLIVRRSGRALSRAAALEICRSTQGNPLFASEIASAVARRGTAPALGEPLPLPTELRDLMRERLEGLSADARRVLLVASAAAHPTVTLLQEAGCAATMEAIARAEEAGVARLLADGELTFSHPLIQAVIYGDASQDERMGVHRRLAAVLKEPVESARHLALSSAVEDETVAGRLMAAAAIARSRGAAGMAGELAKAAADRTPRADVEARADRLIEAGWYYYASNLPEDGRRAAQTVMELHPSRPARSRAQILLLQFTGNSLGNFGDLVDEAVANAAGAPEVEARARYMSVHRFLQQGQAHLALAEAKRALAAAEAAGDVPSLIRSFDALLLCVFTVSPNEFEPTLERAMQLVAAHHSPDGASTQTHRLHARYLAVQRRFPEAHAAIREAMRLAEEYGSLIGVADTTHTAISIEIAAGDYRRALELATQLEAMAESIEEDNTGWILCLLSWVQRVGGSVEKARDLAARGLAVSQRASDWLQSVQSSFSLGAAHLMLGEIGAAIEALRTCRELNLRSEVPYALGYPWAPQLAEALLLAGDIAGARETIDEGAIAARTFNSNLGRDLVELLTDVDRVDALVKAAEGHLDEAVEQLECLLAEQQGRPPIEVARTLVALAGLERRRRRRGVARTLLTQARELCERSGAAPRLAQIDADLARLDSAQPTGEQGDLTPAESRIVGLVLEGASNREIAGALSISIKTVEATLSRIYRKTGAHSRIELVRTHATSR